MFLCIPTYLLQPIATFFVGIVLAVIAFLQFKVAHDKLRLELFDRRYKVYAATKGFLVSIMKDARLDLNALSVFYAGTSDAEFLFDKDVLDYLEQIRQRAIEMDRLQREYQPIPVGEARSKLVHLDSIEVRWLILQITEMSKVFEPYLSYAKVKGDFLEDFFTHHHKT
jgi:hypothetical protein